MNWINSLRVATIFLTFNFRSAGGNGLSIAGVVTEAVDSSQDDQVTELSLLMDILDREYTANCLRVVMTTQESIAVNNSTIDLPKQTIYDNSLFSKNEKDDIAGDKPVMYFDRAKMAITELKRELDNIVTKAHTFTPFKCVSYLLSGPPDPKLMAVLTNKLLRKRLTRYFLVHTQSSTEAEQFLLDQRLGKEENVAALVQEESQNKSYWRVLIRQLLHPSGSPQVLTVNRWSRDTGLTNTENIFPEQMANFYGTKLTGIALTLIPAVAYERTEGSLVVKLQPCLDKSLIDTVAKKLNFTYQVVVPADGIWGYINEKGEFNGLVREVEMGRANFSLSLSKIYVRMRVIDYTYSYYMDALTFITAKRRPPPPWRKVLTPFRINVWLCVLVSVGGGSLLYHIIYHAQATLTSSRLLSSHAFMHVLASFLNQSLDAYLSLQSGKVFMGFWFLYSFLVTSYYKMSLTSTLAVPFIPKNIDTAEELIESGLSYGITPSKGAVYMIFALANIPLHQRMFTNLEYHKSADSMKMVEEGDYSFVYWKSFLDPRVARHNNNPNRKNDIHMAKDTLFPGSKAWIVTKGAPYERTFSDVIKRCVQVGLITKWKKDAVDSFLKVWQKEDNPEGKLVKGTDRKEVVFSLDHLQGPFSMLLLGYLGGVLLLVLEVLMGK